MPSLHSVLRVLLAVALLAGCGGDEALPDPRTTNGDSREPAAPARLQAQQRPVAPVNHAPVLLGVQIDPFGEVTVRHDIVARPQAEDRDGDPIRFRYAWRVNGTPAAFDGDTLPRETFRRGDWIDLTIVASDGHAASEPFTAKPFEVLDEMDGAGRRELALEPDPTSSTSPAAPAPN